jgi:hypothetical protein
MPINDRSKYQYDEVTNLIEKNNQPAFFWQFLPRSSRNWLLCFSLTNASNEMGRFAPSLLKSGSRGPNYYLYWVDQQRAPDYRQFAEFAAFLSGYLFTVSSEPASG